MVSLLELIGLPFDRNMSWTLVYEISDQGWIQRFKWMLTRLESLYASMRVDETFSLLLTSSTNIYVNPLFYMSASSHREESRGWEAYLVTIEHVVFIYFIIIFLSLLKNFI